MNNIKYEKIDEKIYVYKNLLKNPSELVNILKDSENNPEKSFLFRDWAKWSVFGTYVYEVFDNKPEKLTKDQEERFELELSYHLNVMDSFFKTTEHFLNNFNIDVNKEWKIAGPSYSKYLSDNETDGLGHKELSMLYHTDYQWMDPDSPKDEFMLTCTMYLNDDYDRGGLKFAVKDKRINYKPKAGDIVIFPSGHPELLSEDGIYYHAVDKVKNNDKYLIRMFYTKNNPGTETWLANQKKYGKDLWEKMEKERIKNLVDYSDKSSKIENGEMA